MCHDFLLIGAESHTGEYIANVFKNIIEEVGPMKVLGICTDNATNMKKAWEIIQAEYPHIQPYGCLAHTLNLIFIDINKIKSAEDIQRNCTNIVKNIKRSQRLTALLNQQQKHQPEQRQHALKLPVKTRCVALSSKLPLTQSLHLLINKYTVKIHLIRLLYNPFNSFLKMCIITSLFLDISKSHTLKSQ